MFKIKMIVDVDGYKMTLERELLSRDKWSRSDIKNQQELIGICVGDYEHLIQKLSRALVFTDPCNVPNNYDE